MSLDWSGQRVLDSWDSVLNQSATYGYDDMNRLASRTITAGTPQNFTYTYDRWGNRTAQTALQSGPTDVHSFNAKNQIASGTNYDAAGNVIWDGTHLYSYDAENNVVSVDNGASGVYTYNALNQRVRVTASGGTSEFVFHPNGKRASTREASSPAMFTSTECR